jgi:hypothetical protein
LFVAHETSRDGRSRWRIALAVGLSLLAHALLLALPAKPPPPILGGTPGPLNVTLGEPEPAPPPQVAPPPTPVPQPVPPQPVPPQPVPPQPRAPRKPRETPPPVVVQAPAPAPSLPEPAPAVPQVDMLAMINARRDKRRAEEAAAARAAAPESSGAPATPESSAKESIARNLQSLGGGDEGVGGVFEILRKGTRTGEFSFNGFRGESQKRWREVIEVDAGAGGDIERAMVRSMIWLIRQHYTADFNWKSPRLGRVVVLSARPEDNAQLEEYLLREFFGTSTLNRTK